MFRFSKYTLVYLIISGMVLVPGIVTLLTAGLRPSVDFTGGTLIELVVTGDVPDDTVERVASEAGLTITGIQKTGDKVYVLRMPSSTDQTIDSYIVALDQAGAKPLLRRVETVGPVLGQELLRKTLTASAFAIVVMLLYIAYAFKQFTYGVSAIIALVHDLLVVVGLFAVFGKYLGVEVDTLFVTALLTTMSFSVHDTIVVFDRIREKLKLKGRYEFSQIADAALTETFGRSLVNSLTIVFMLTALVLMGGESIKWFAVALLIGTISGTYSSPFVATQVLVWWEKRKHRRTTTA